MIIYVVSLSPAFSCPVGGSLDQRLLAGLAQDVWDRMWQQRSVLLRRQEQEAEAVWLLQQQQWRERLRDVGETLGHRVDYVLSFYYHCAGTFNSVQYCIIVCLCRNIIIAAPTYVYKIYTKPKTM